MYILNYLLSLSSQRRKYKMKGFAYIYQIHYLCLWESKLLLVISKTQHDLYLGPLNSLNLFQHFLFSHLMLALVCTILFSISGYLYILFLLFPVPHPSSVWYKPVHLLVSAQVYSLWELPWINQSESIIPFFCATAVSYFYYGPYNTILHYLSHLQNYTSYLNSKILFYFTIKYSSDPQRNWLLILC